MKNVSFKDSIVTNIVAACVRYDLGEFFATLAIIMEAPAVPQTLAWRPQEEV